jgi:hypothetical protein
MERKPQQQTLSIRISDALREFLERSKHILSNGRGEPVSTSDVAKILLESAKEERLDFRIEVADLQERPTESMWTIRKKWEMKHALSRAEWIFLGHYVQIACEEVTDNPAKPDIRSYTAVLEAVLSVRALRRSSNAILDLYYLDNVGVPDAIPISELELRPGIASQALGNLVQQMRAAAIAKPVFAGKLLYVALRDEEVSDIMALNRALDPYLETLFRLAARGHWIREHRPVRVRTGNELVSEYIPSLEAEGFHLAFVIGSGGELRIMLSMQAKDVGYPLASYPQIQEFAEMLRRLQPGGIWNGTHFFGHGAAAAGDRPAWLRFWRRGDEIALAFSVDEWECLKGLFTTALESPQLQPILAELALVYGEI